MSSKTNAFNAYESTLNGGITDSGTSLIVDSAGGMIHPTYLVIDPDSPTLREIIRCDNISGTTFSSLTRGLAGSASGGQAHASGAVIRSTPVHQELDDLYTDITALEAADSGHFGGTDTDDHPEVTTGTRGFASAADKMKLDGIADGAVAAHSATTGQGVDDHHNEDHASRHDEGAADELTGLANGGYFSGTHVYFTADGTFTKADHTGLRAIRIRCQGGGGAGGGAEATGVAEASVGGGGGGGAYAEHFVLASALGASETVTVGDGGTGVSGVAGNTGGDSSFGSFVTANGGLGGPVRPASAVGFGTEGGAGGGATGGDLLTGGDAGGSAWAVFQLGISGVGGASVLGGGARNRFTSATGQQRGGFPGSEHGGGGSGGINSASVSASIGGDGADGIVIVELLF